MRRDNSEWSSSTMATEALRTSCELLRACAMMASENVLLFLSGTVFYEISVAALGILLATFTGTMGQFGLLVVPVLVILNLLSGSTTRPESMPDWLIKVMQFTPTPHFVSFAQGVLYRAAGLDIV